MALASYGFNLWNDAFPSKTNVMTLQWGITAAKTVTPLPIINSGVLPTFDAFSSQAVIDNFLLTTNEFLLAQFDATSMGTDTFGCLVKMNNAIAATTSVNVGQCASVEAMTVSVHSGSQGATVTANGVVSVATLTSTSNTTQVAVGANGDVAFRFVSSGMDILTSGLITVNLFWTSK